MKRISFVPFALLIAVAIANACSVNDPEGQFSGSREKGEYYDIVCNIEDFVPAAGTKVTNTVSGSEVTSVWNDGDVIGVFPDRGGDQVLFKVSGGAGTGTCTFDGAGWGLKPDTRYSAYYPYHSDNYGGTDAMKNIKISYDGQAQAKKGAFEVGAFDYLAFTNVTPEFVNVTDRNGACTFTFKHLGALLVVDLKFPKPASLTKLELISSGNLFTKAGSLDLSQDSPAIVSTSKGNTLALDLDRMPVAANEIVRFYLMAAPDNLSTSSLSVRITTVTGVTMNAQFASSYNLEAGKAYTLAANLVAMPGATLNVPEAGEGLTIFNTTGNYKYRYGPSIIMNDNGTIDAWFAAPGTGGRADEFKYRRTSNGGQTWTAEQTALTGGPSGSKDWWSVCDPGAAFFDGYYYLAYTSTTNTTSSGALQGLENDCFIARGTSPTGPWERWNGNGWGGNAEPIIEYTGPAGKWGIGEPSIVVKDDTIFLYYTYDDGVTPLTKVATASRDNANWPGSLTHHGTAVDKYWLAIEHDHIDPSNPDLAPLLGSYDSCDVKYVEDYGLFYAFHTSWRITALSRLSVWTSTDGLNFTYMGDVSGNVIIYAHNMGVSGDGLGHVNLSKQQFVSYAYSPADVTDRAHGRWSTYWSVLTY